VSKIVAQDTFSKVRGRSNQRLRPKKAELRETPRGGLQNDDADSQVSVGNTNHNDCWRVRMGSPSLSTERQN